MSTTETTQSITSGVLRYLLSYKPGFEGKVAYSTIEKMFRMNRFYPGMPLGKKRFG